MMDSHPLKCKADEILVIPPWAQPWQSENSVHFVGVMLLDVVCPGWTKRNQYARLTAAGMIGGI